MKASTDTQLPLALHIPVVLTPQGGGEFLVKPGKPVEWLTPKEFALRIGLSRDTVYRHIGTDALPDRFVEFAGPRKIRIQAAAIAHWESHWRDRRLHGL